MCSCLAQLPPSGEIKGGRVTIPFTPTAALVFLESMYLLHETGFLFRDVYLCYLYVFASYCFSVLGFYDPLQSACVCIFLVSLSICEFACGCMSLCVSGQLFVNVCVCVYVSVWTFLYETTLCAHVCWSVSICTRFCVSMGVCVCVCRRV